MSRTTSRTFTFGPGRMEAMQVTAYAGRRTGVTGQKVARVEGTFLVYCDSGTYAVAISERFSAFASEAASGLSEEAVLVVKAAAGDADAAYDLADLAVEYALEGWYDPAQDAEGEEVYA